MVKSISNAQLRKKHKICSMVIPFLFPNCWLRKKPKIYDALGFLRSQDLPLESKFYKAFRFLRSALANGIPRVEWLFRYTFGQLGWF